MPRPSAIPPAAITGTRTASTTCGSSAKKHAAVAAGFGALGDDDVGAVFLEPDRLANDGRGRHHNATGRLDARQKRRLRQAKMEADNFRLQLLDQSAHRDVQRSAVVSVDRGRGVDSQFLVISRQTIAPSGLAPRVRIDSSMAEEG